MKKILLIITVILTSVSSAWADGITAGTFQIAEATTGKIVTNGSQFGPQNWSSYVGIAENANTSWKIEASGNYFIIKPTDNNNNYLGAGNENSRNEQDIAFNDIGSAQEYRFDDAGDNTYYIYNVTKGRWMCLNSYNSNTQLGFNDNQSNRAKFRLLPGFVSIDPVNLTSGWYQIKWHDNNGATGTNIMSDVQGKYIKNHQEEVTVGNDKHSIYLDTHSSRQVNDIVTTFVYLDVKEQTKPNSNASPNGCRAILRGLNGHSISYTGAISQTDVNVYPIRVGGSGEQLLRCTLTSSAATSNNRQTMIPMDNGNTKYMGNVTNQYPYAYWSKVDISSCGLQPWTVKFVTQTDITVEYTGSSNYGIDKVYDGGTFFFDTDIVPDASDFTCNPGTGENTPYYNPGILIDTEDKTITVLPYPNRDIDVPSGSNGYIGGKTTIGETEWKTKEYWSLTDTWNDAGSGCTPTSGDGMWSPIYLKDITGGTVPTLDGWNFRMIADHSTYEIASVGKIQGGMDCYFTLKNTSVVTMNFGTGHTFNFTINLNEGTGNILNFVMSNGYQCTTNSCTECPSRSTITVNYGDVTKDTNRQFNASGSGNIKKLVLNATFTEPAEYNNVEEITLVTFSNVSASTITTTNLTPVGDGWTPVNNKAELETKTTAGKFYFIESNSDGVKLYTYKPLIYNVAANSTETLSQISEYESYKFFNVPENSTLIIDINNFDLTKITGSGTINLTANTTLSEGQSISAVLSGSGKITLNYFPTAETHPTFNDNWTGSIEFAEGGSNSTNLTALFNAWGNSNSTIMLNNVNGGYLITYDSNYPTTTAVNPTLNIPADITLILNNGNSKANARISKVTGAGTIDRQGWSGSTQHNLYITTLTGFTGTLNGSGYPIIVENLVRTLGPTVDERLFKTSGTVYFSKSAPYNSKLYIGDMDVTAAYAWENTTKDNVSGYYITESAPAKIEAAKNEVRPYIGTGTGKYSITFDGKIYTEFETFADDVDKLKTLADWTNKTISYSTINQPTSGYYRIKSKYNENNPGYYLSCENISNSDDTNAKQTITTDEKNIFYIEVGNTNSTILSYSTGYYFGNNTRANYTSVTDNPVKWTFSDGNNKGTYKLTSDWSDGSKILYGWSGRDNEAKADRNGAATTDGHTDWILISVAEEELPVIPAPGVSDASRPVLLGNITSASDVINNITASAKFVDLSQATIGTSIDEIKAEVAKTNPNAIIIAPEGTSVGESTSNVLLTTDTENTFKCNNLQLNDDVIAQFTGETPTTFTKTDVTYTRPTSSQWGTICLPYATSTGGEYSYYRLVDTKTGNLRFEKVTEETTIANEPYLIKKEDGNQFAISSENKEFSIGVAGDVDEIRRENSDFILQGVMINTSVVDGVKETQAKDASYTSVTDPNAYYFIAADNTFRKMNGRFNLKAFRAYLSRKKVNDADARTNIAIEIIHNDEPTGISFIESEDGNTVDVIFDLNGRRLQNTKKGINIINGKKVIK